MWRESRFSTNAKASGSHSFQERNVRRGRFQVKQGARHTLECHMKHLALAAASAFLAVAGIGIAAADDSYPVRDREEALAIERHRAAEFSAIQPDPYYYGNNPGTRATGADPYDRSNDLPRTVIYQAPASSTDDQSRADAKAENEAAAVETRENDRADQASTPSYDDRYSE